MREDIWLHSVARLHNLMIYLL